MDRLLFWMQNPRDRSLEYVQWIAFREDMAAAVVALVAAFAALIVVAYGWHCRRWKIRQPADLFRPFSPLRWLAMSIVPGLTVALLFRTRYTSRFPGAQISYLIGAIEVALWTTLLTLVVAQCLIWIPGVTPAKFRYHPLWPLRLFSRGGA